MKNDYIERAMQEESRKKWEFRLAVLIGALAFITLMLVFAGGVPSIY